MNRARFFNSWLRTNRASHPSGSSDRRWSAFALAAWPPQKNVGAASRPMDCTDSWLPGFLAPTPGGLALQAIRVAARVTANGIPFRLVAGAPGPFPERPSHGAPVRSRRPPHRPDRRPRPPDLEPDRSGRHLRMVGCDTPNSRPIALGGIPLAVISTIRARYATACGVRRERTTFSSSLR
jgi:hypothetical protein